MHLRVFLVQVGIEPAHGWNEITLTESCVHPDECSAAEISFIIRIQGPAYRRTPVSRDGEPTPRPAASPARSLRRILRMPQSSRARFPDAPVAGATPAPDLFPEGSMKRSLIPGALLLLVPFAACDTERGELLLAPTLSPSAPPVAAHAAGPAVFVAPADGAQEVPSVDTRARGNTVFQLREDGLHYRLTVANVHDVTMAHIHRAPSGVNGPVVVWLYPDAPPPELIAGRSSGTLATGVITDDHLVGPLAGMGLEALLELLRSGEGYVNVHTAAYPAGEIRGQIRPAGGR
jgi:hypothetical protein